MGQQVGRDGTGDRLLVIRYRQETDKSDNRSYQAPTGNLVIMKLIKSYRHETHKSDDRSYHATTVQTGNDESDKTILQVGCDGAGDRILGPVSRSVGPPHQHWPACGSLARRMQGAVGRLGVRAQGEGIRACACAG